MANENSTIPTTPELLLEQSYEPKKIYQVVGPDGVTYDAYGENVPKLLSLGGRLESPDERKAREEKREYSDAGSQAMAGIIGAIDGALPGAGSLALNMAAKAANEIGITNDIDASKYAKYNPWTTAMSEMAGAVALPGGLGVVTKLGKVVKSVAGAKKIIDPLSKIAEVADKSVVLRALGSGAKLTGAAAISGAASSVGRRSRGLLENPAETAQLIVADNVLSSALGTGLTAGVGAGLPLLGGALMKTSGGAAKLFAGRVQGPIRAAFAKHEEIASRRHALEALGLDNAAIEDLLSNSEGLAIADMLKQKGILKDTIVTIGGKDIDAGDAIMSKATAAAGLNSGHYMARVIAAASKAGSEIGEFIDNADNIAKSLPLTLQANVVPDVKRIIDKLQEKSAKYATIEGAQGYRERINSFVSHYGKTKESLPSYKFNDDGTVIVIPKEKIREKAGKYTITETRQTTQKEKLKIEPWTYKTSQEQKQLYGSAVEKMRREGRYAARGTADEAEYDIYKAIKEEQERAADALSTAASNSKMMDEDIKSIASNWRKNKKIYSTLEPIRKFIPESLLGEIEKRFDLENWYQLRPDAASNIIDSAARGGVRTGMWKFGGGTNAFRAAMSIPLFAGATIGGNLATKTKMFDALVGGSKDPLMRSYIKNAADKGWAFSHIYSQNAKHIDNAVDNAVNYVFKTSSAPRLAAAERSTIVSANRDQDETAMKKLSERALALANNPILANEKIMAHMQSLTEIDEKLGAQGIATGQKALGVLVRHAWRPDVGNSITPMVDIKNAKPSKQQVNDFNQASLGVLAPIEVFNKIGNGTATKKMVDSLREVYPDMWARFIEQFTLKLNRLNKPARYRALAYLSALGGVPLHKTLGGGYVNASQSVYGGKQVSAVNIPGKKTTLPSSVGSDTTNLNMRANAR